MVGAALVVLSVTMMALLGLICYRVKTYGEMRLSDLSLGAQIELISLFALALMGLIAGILTLVFD